MNDQTKILIGATIGGAFGYFIGAVIVEIIAIKENPPEHYSDYEDEELEEQQENTPMLKENEDIMSRNKKKTDRVEKNYTKHFVSQDRPELEALAAKYRGEELEDESVSDTVVQDTINIDEAWEEETDDTDVVDPRVVSSEEYENAPEGFTLVALNYYDDDVVTDQKNRLVDRPERFLGDALFDFDEDDTIYVQNLARQAMYKVVKTNTEFIPQSESPRERAVRKMTKKEEDNGEEPNA